jgi:phosphotransferase system HPr (HPr) family protein
MSAKSEVAMYERRIRIPDGVDLHARPAGTLIRAAAQYQSSITLTAGAKTADAKSILQVLGLGATGGTEITISTAGADASDALDAIAELLERLA